MSWVLIGEMNSFLKVVMMVEWLDVMFLVRDEWRVALKDVLTAVPMVVLRAA